LQFTVIRPRTGPQIGDAALEVRRRQTPEGVELTPLDREELEVVSGFHGHRFLLSSPHCLFMLLS
jgi:hypothetical protein